MKIRDLKNLGVKSEALLSAAGIHSVDQLRTIGPIAAYILVQDAQPVSRNLLYALVGAFEERHWASFNQHEKLEIEHQVEIMKEAHRTGDIVISAGG